MLLNFRVTNHRSLREEQEFQLHPAYEADRPEGTEWGAVPVAGIFGANAAGKSNLVDALTYMSGMVTRSHRNSEPDGGVDRTPFRLDAAATGEPSWYVADLQIESVRYTYGFSVDDEHVIEEWLYRYPKGRKQIVFERTGEDVRAGGAQPAQEFNLIQGITEPNVLFISLAARSKQDAVRPVYDWFDRFLMFNQRCLGGFPIHQGGVLSLFEEPQKYPELLELLSAADLGIEDLGTETAPAAVDLPAYSGSSDPAHQRLVAQMELRRRRALSRPWLGHRGRQGVVRLGLSDQSAGTRALLEQLPQIFTALREGGTLVVDEIDSSLHPLLTTKLIGLFQTAETNPRAAQLIFTSHDVSLLGRVEGEDILKRDQVWFVEKDQHGESTLVALAEFRPRQDENRERRYLGGSYGAVPFIDDGFARAVLAAREERDERSR